MSRSRRVLLALLSLVVIGLAQGAAGKRNRMLVVIGVWLGFGFLLLTRVSLVAVIAIVIWDVLAAVDGYRQLGTVPRAHRPLGVLAFVLGSVGGGFLPLAASTFKVPSSSSYPTFEIGDRIVVNKLASPERGDTIVFRWPCNPTRSYIKRLVGMPGETIEVRCSRVYVNGAEVKRTLVARTDEYLDYSRPVEVSRYRESTGGRSYDVFQDRDQPAWDEGGSPEEHMALERGAYDFPEGAALPSCEGQMESMSEPEVRGTIISSPEIDGAGVCARRYQFTIPEGTYFVLGDNRINSNDSRAWGVVPAENVIGVVSSIFWPPSRAGSVP